MPDADPLQNEFLALWPLMSQATGTLLIAGGYGLFLKQLWLRDRQEDATLRHVVPLERWINASPRATNDLDLVMGLDLLVDAQNRDTIHQALQDRGFEVNKPKWQFVKRLDEYRKIQVDLHSPIPDEPQTGFKVDRIRVRSSKKSPPLQNVHGRTNAEADGCELLPFTIQVAHLDVLVPNPVTWCVMKITAMAERLAKSQADEVAPAQRASARAHAEKHARDLFRIVAMTTRQEAEQADKVINYLRTRPAYLRAQEIRTTHMPADATGPVLPFVADAWRNDDLRALIRMLETWFP